MPPRHLIALRVALVTVGIVAHAGVMMVQVLLGATRGDMTRRDDRRTTGARQ